MSCDIKSISLTLFATMAAACSATPRSSAPQALAAANNASSPAAAVTAAPTIEVDANLVKAGYSVMKRQGEIYYCRNEIITGQRIGTRVCQTAAQLQVEKQNVTKARDLMNQPSYQCLGASCNN